MKTISIAALIALSLGVSARAQSLKDTTDFIHDFTETHGSFGDSNWQENFRVQFEGCTMKVSDTLQDISCLRIENRDVCGKNPKPSSPSHSLASVNLKDLEPISLITDVDRDVSGGYGGYWIQLTARNDRPKVATTGDEYSFHGLKIYRTSLGLDSSSNARRTAKALNHAIKLCGGKASAF